MLLDSPPASMYNIWCILKVYILNQLTKKGRTMATTSYTITGNYQDLALGVLGVYIQSKGTATIELFIANTTPNLSDEGISLSSDSPGIAITLSEGETIYAKTEDINAVSTIVCVY